MLKFATFNNEINKIKRTREAESYVYYDCHFASSLFYVVNWPTIVLYQEKVKEIK